MIDKNYTIAIHGGAGAIRLQHISQQQKVERENALCTALAAGINILQNHGTAVDAVQASVSYLEDSPYFNAGRGSVFTHHGTQEMDAALMCGKTLNVGAVSLLSGVRNPIVLCRTILDKSEHLYLAGKGAAAFARLHHLVFENEAWFATENRKKQLQEAQKRNRVQLDHNSSHADKFGTVGAVALDIAGNIAAATSTGGMTNKKYGRIGDSPLIGCGTYANNSTCAVSCTGHGELFIKNMVAYDVSCLMEYKGLSLQAACNYVVHKKLPKGSGGLIAVDTKGNVGLPFNSLGMYRAWLNTNKEIEVAVQ